MKISLQKVISHDVARDQMLELAQRLLSRCEEQQLDLKQGAPLACELQIISQPIFNLPCLSEAHSRSIVRRSTSPQALTNSREAGWNFSGEKRILQLEEQLKEVSATFCLFVCSAAF